MGQEIVRIYVPTHMLYRPPPTAPHPQYVSVQEQLQALIDSGHEIVSVIPEYRFDQMPNCLPTLQLVGYLAVIDSAKGGA